MTNRHVTLTAADHERLVRLASGGFPFDLSTIQVGDELVLRVTVTQINPPSWHSGPPRVLFTDNSDMLAEVHPITIMGHFPMRDLPRIGRSSTSLEPEQ